MEQNPTRRWMIAVTVMLVTCIEILDMTIVNVSLPTMMGELGANSDQITWVLTSYIVSSAVFMPLTGLLVARIGSKKLLMSNIIGFMLASMLCGMSVTLPQMVVFRIFQGIFGASLVPLSQYILNRVFPKEEQGMAMAIWGIGVMVAPIFGPTLGGYITDSMNWRWVFYINVPVCLLTFFLTWQLIQETAIKLVKIDWVGLGLLATGISCLQIFLDRGNTDDWFNSHFIVLLTVAWVFLLVLFVLRGIGKQDNVINLHLFHDRNFSVASFMLMVFGAGLFGIVALLPLMLERLMGYDAQTAGLLMMPRGIAAMFGMIITARLMKRIDARWIVFWGIIISALGTYWMCGFNLSASFAAMVWPTVVVGVGNGLFFVPMTVMALSTLSPADAAEGSGVFNFFRSLGGSIGISILSTILTRESQINWNRLAGKTYISNPHFQQWFQIKHLSPAMPQALKIFMLEIERQSSMIAFIDAYWFAAISLIVLLPLVLLLKKTSSAGPSLPIH